MNKNTLVIIGNGMATNRLLEELDTQHPFDEIIVLGEEHIPYYNRIMLSPLLANETKLEAITPHDDDWYQERKITVQLGTVVISVDTELKKVTTESQEIYYDTLVFATGSRSFIPPVKGKDHPQVIGFRNIADVDQMTDQLDQLEHVTVVGGGLLGIEAAVGLRLQGLEVSLVQRESILMNRQLDKVASDILCAELNQRGIRVLAGNTPMEIVSEGNQLSYMHIENKEGVSSNIKTDMVVFATGIIPNAEIAKEAGLEAERAICVNQYMQTSEQNIYAFGECCQFNGTLYGLVAPIWDQAKVLANQLRNQQDLVYFDRDSLTKLKVSGLDIHSIGEFNTPDDGEEITIKDLESGVYKKLVLKKNQIIGVLCVGEVNDTNWYFDLMSEKVDISDIRASLLFGQAFCQ